MISPVSTPRNRFILIWACSTTIALVVLLASNAIRYERSPDWVETSDSEIMTRKEMLFWTRENADHEWEMDTNAEASDEAVCPSHTVFSHFWPKK